MFVGKLNATDRDQPSTKHVAIRYTLLDGRDLFSINPNTGAIATATDSLDREVDPHAILLMFLCAAATLWLCFSLDQR